MLRVATYNLREGGEDRIGSFAALLQRTHADAVGLVEANSLVNIETLGRELSTDVMYGEANSPACVAWFSRLPIRSSTNHRLPELAKTPLEVEVLWDDGPLRLCATHLADRFEEVTRPRQAEVQAICLPDAPRHTLRQLFDAG